jgi:uncharacterized protein YjeT (DUF2065 family)|tara:strand:+ start:86 stop:196 length:111 start_codon:yes stop_codon:yes gene_type:complete
MFLVWLAMAQLIDSQRRIFGAAALSVGVVMLLVVRS